MGVKTDKSYLILKIRAYTPICKPLNGSLPRSNTSHFLRLWEFPYQYVNGKQLKETTAISYFIKGLRGILRHQAMTQCEEKKLDVCHTSDKETDKHGNSLLPNGFHLLGECMNNNAECIIHAVFGSKGHTSKVQVTAHPIANITHKTYQSDYHIQKVHIATEHRVNLSYDGKSIQEFGERYFAGEFEFEIDVTKCNKAELGMVVEAVMYLHKLGRGFNSGYGQLQVRNLILVKRTVVRGLKWTNGENFEVTEQIDEQIIPEDIPKALEAWGRYVEVHSPLYNKIS